MAQINLVKDEKILTTALANHWRSIEAVGGEMKITNKRIIFTPHKLNIQRNEQSFPLSEIKTAYESNTLGFIPNGMTVEMKNGKKEKFVIWNRFELINKIKELTAQ